MWELLEQRELTEYDFGSSPGLGNAQHNISHRIRPPVPKCKSERYTELMVMCWHKDPSRRPSLGWLKGELERIPEFDHPKSTHPQAWWTAVPEREFVHISPHIEGFQASVEVTLKSHWSTNN